MANSSCNNKMLGVVVRQDDQFLLVRKPRSFLCGFLSSHITWKPTEYNVYEYVERRLGIQPQKLRTIYRGKLDNHCRRKAKWHDWVVFQASDCKGDMRPYSSESEILFWMSRAELKESMKRIAGIQESFNIQSSDLLKDIIITIGVRTMQEIADVAVGMLPLWYQILTHTDIFDNYGTSSELKLYESPF